MSRSDRRRSPGPSRRSRSPPPAPRDENELPESFGRVLAERDDDENDVLFRMVNSFTNSPLGCLTQCLDRSKKLKVWTRNFKEVRGICTGYVLAFDKHWNILMKDVDEVFLKPKKAKTPFLLPVSTAADYKELPKKTPKVKKNKDTEEIAPEPTKEPEAVAEGTAKKKRRRKKKRGPNTERRHIDMMLIRGDNIVMAAII